MRQPEPKPFDAVSWSARVDELLRDQRPTEWDDALTAHRTLLRVTGAPVRCDVDDADDDGCPCGKTDAEHCDECCLCSCDGRCGETTSQANLRRALARRNEATHPVELPPNENTRAALQGWVDLPWHEHLVTPSPLTEPGAYEDPAVQRAVAEAIATNTVHDSWQEGDPCQLCGEPPTDRYGDDDVLAEFSRGPHHDTVVAHAQCGLDLGLELA